MSDIQLWLKDNDMVIELASVTDKITGQLIDDATITATLKDSVGADVGGIAWPQTIDFTGTSGLYQKTIDKSVVIVDGDGYTLIVDLSTPGGTDAHWEIPVGGDLRTE
ncbi:MAG: hypothetical protein BMS9Abin02_1992 [Anaerolineae bacterium]|nr:MAG: hypothetical protein BMS9Abin02_1992 [Anaerolineae bacterium]